MTYQYKREPLEDRDVDNIINACKTRKEKFVVWILLDTGLRVSELSNLKKGNIQWQEKRLMIYGKGGPYGKKTKRRIIPLSERAFRLIEAWFVEQEDVNMSIRTIQRIVKCMASKAGITKPVTPHVLRHTFAVSCVRKGISTRALQEFMGHDHLATTEIYLNLSPEMAVDEFKKKW